ncbi:MULTISPECIES: hypothetical protein [Acetobacter]|nr:MULTISPECIES: hypothetical protein [Acetobacter]
MLIAARKQHHADSEKRIFGQAGVAGLVFITEPAAWWVVPDQRA